MFLNQLSQPIQKVLFMEWALLMMMSSDENEVPQNPNDETTPFSLNHALLGNISEAEKAMLFEYKQSLFANNENDNFGLGFFIKKIQGNDSLLLELLGEHADAFQTALNNTIQKVAEHYGSNPAVKQKVMEYLVANGEDIFTLTPDKIQAAMFRCLPQITQLIIQQTAKQVFQEKQEQGELFLSINDKKIILCELVGAGFSSGSLDDAEKKLLQAICQILELDLAYLNEFIALMGAVFRVQKSLSDLINE